MLKHMMSSPPPTTMKVDGAEPRAACAAPNLLTSQLVCSSVCSIVLDFSVGQSLYNGLKFVWEEHCIASAHDSDNIFSETMQIKTMCLCKMKMCNRKISLVCTDCHLSIIYSKLNINN